MFKNSKYELVSGHLWLEEYLIGNKEVNFEKEIVQRQKRVIKANKEIRSIIENASLPHTFLEHFTLIEAELYKLKALANHRIEVNKIAGYDRKLNREFDIRYHKLQELIAEFEQQLNILVKNEREFRQLSFTFLILLFLLFNGGIFFLLYKIRNKSLLYYEKLLEQKKAFESIYQYSADGVCLVKDESIYDCNDSLLRIFSAKSKERLIGIDPSELSPPLQPDGSDSYAKAKKMFSLAVENGNHTFEWQHKRLNGELFMAEIALTTIKLDSEMIVHALLRDIDKRIRLEKEYEENQRILFQQLKMAQMGSMLSSIAHQWKQPLSKINAKLLKLSTSLSIKGEEQEILDKNIQDIEVVTSYLGETIENFRTYFKPSHEKKIFNAREIINRAYALSSVSDSSDIAFINSCNETIEYYGYEDELLQVMIILINNAKEAHEERETVDPYIDIKVVDYALNLEIMVIDNAGGIDEKITDKIFNPYFSTLWSMFNNSSLFGTTFLTALFVPNIRDSERDIDKYK